MIHTIAAIAPLFGLIAIGYGTRRANIFSATSQREISRFVIYLALPTLLFQIVARARPAELWQPDFILVFGGGCAATFAMVFFIRRRCASPVCSVIDALTGAYGNAAFVGIPLCVALLGPGSYIASMIASILTICVLFAFAVLIVELAKHPDASLLSLIRMPIAATLRNPLVLAPILGCVVSFSGLTLPRPVTAIVDLLAAVASPCALVAIGMFIGNPRSQTSARTVAFLTATKLIVQPLATWGIAVLLAPISSLTFKAALLLAALPTGTGPFMLAELYGEKADVAARTILVSTLISILSITCLVALLGNGP